MLESSYVRDLSLLLWLAVAAAVMTTVAGSLPAVADDGRVAKRDSALADRSAPLPTGGHIHQSDGTSWMAMYSLNLMRIALELALHNPVYDDIATTFFEHFQHIAEAMTSLAGEGSGCGTSRTSSTETCSTSRTTAARCSGCGRWSA
jgi:hypothetical protein